MADKTTITMKEATKALIDEEVREDETYDEALRRIVRGYSEPETAEEALARIRDLAALVEGEITESMSEPIQTVGWVNSSTADDETSEFDGANCQ